MSQDIPASRAFGAIAQLPLPLPAPAWQPGERVRWCYQAVSALPGVDQTMIVEGPAPDRLGAYILRPAEKGPLAGPPQIYAWAWEMRFPLRKKKGREPA